MGNACAKDENKDTTPMADSEFLVQENHALRGPAINDQFDANRNENQDAKEDNGHLQSNAESNPNHGVKDSFDPYMQKMNGTLCKDLSAIEEWPEPHNDKVNLTLSRVGDFHQPDGDIYADDLRVSNVTKKLGNSFFKGDFTFYTSDLAECYRNSSDLILCDGTARGKQVWNDGTVYEGTLECGRFHGAGRLIHANGDYYEGLWENGQANGYGKWVSFDGDNYDGNWKDSRPHGTGKYEGVYGWTYVGSFHEGARTGDGELNIPNKLNYNGEFQMGLFHGPGYYQWLDGSSREYSGDFDRNEMSGLGTFTYKNGDVYYGLFAKNKKHGKGKMMFANGMTWEGNWSEGFKNGHGKVFNEHETIYEGQWTHGKMNQNVESEWVSKQVAH